jgi:hypothetical protein
MKITRLKGALLDYMVLKAEGYAPHNGGPYWVKDGMPVVKLSEWQPSVNWAQGGPIIERENIELLRFQGTRSDGSFGSVWYGGRDLRRQGADTPLVAAMRAYVAAKFGEEFPSEELGVQA